MTDKFSTAGDSWLHPVISKVRRTERKPHGGGMLVLITALTLGIVLGLIFFGLNYVRLTGSGAEQKKAIEAAALAAANDLSRVVINTPQFGYVSISDDAPIGKTTTAGDNFFLQVRSVNTLIGTARLEKMLASVIPADPGDALNYLADQDLANAQIAARALETELVASLAPRGSARDINGDPIRPYADALAAYQANAQRISGKSTYVPNSLTLSIGQSTQELATNIPVPVTARVAPVVPGGSQINNFYKSNVNVPFGGNDYVFMAVGSSSALLDPKNFVASLPNLPYQYPSIVQASAKQVVTQTNNQNPGGSTIYSAACAEPASIYDPLPAPGAMSFSFPDGMIPEISSPYTMLTDVQLNAPANSGDCFTSSGGDYPSDQPAASLSHLTWFAPPGGPEPPIGVAYRAALFDWFRRAGTKAKIDSVLSQLTAPFPSTNTMVAWNAYVPPPVPEPPKPPPWRGWPEPPPPPPPPPVPVPYPSKGVPLVFIPVPIPQGLMHIYKFNPDGTVSHTIQVIKPFPYSVASQNQLYVVSYNAFVSKDPYFAITTPGIPAMTAVRQNTQASLTLTNTWDAFIRDECRVPGTIKGGKHAGEPVQNPIVAAIPQSKDNQIAWTDRGGSGSGADPGGPNGNGPGLGNVPIITEQDGWSYGMFSYLGQASLYQIPPVGPATGEVRPTYATNGTAFDIRFRRQVELIDALVPGVGKIGYLAD